MRIGIELFGTQTQSRHRGIGRYARSLAAALLERGQPSDCEFVLYAQDGLPTDLVPSAANATPRWLAPDPARGETHLSHVVDRLVATNPDALDMLLLTNPLELTPGYDIPRRDPDGLPLVSIVHDLIPLLFPDDYIRKWPGTGYARRYFQALERLKSYDMLLTDSEASRSDVLAHLGVPAARVISIAGASDDYFRAPASAALAEVPSPLRRLGIDGPFVFAVSASDPRKNLSGLLEGYARVRAELRQSYPLVITAALSKEEVAHVRALSVTLGIAPILTGRVDDETLRLLYQRCAGFLFPSMYEGLGIPILEAMHCGAPTIAGRNSAQIETVGDAGLLVDASEPTEISAALARVLTDTSLAAALRARGPAQARQFTWERTARLVLSTLEGVVERRRAASSESVLHDEKLPVAFVASRSRAVDQGLRRLAELGFDAPIDVFQDEPSPRELRDASGTFRIFDLRLLPRFLRIRFYRSIVFYRADAPFERIAANVLGDFPEVVTLDESGEIIPRGGSESTGRVETPAARRTDRGITRNGARSRRPVVRGPSGSRMTDMIKSILRAGWRLTLPVRRPLTNKLENYLARCLAAALQRNAQGGTTTSEQELLLDTLLTENFRLQRQVEELRRLWTRSARDVDAPLAHKPESARAPHLRSPQRGGSPAELESRL